jgi:hypothetical protein
MNALRTLLLPLLICPLATTPRAQQEATTLSALCQRASAIVTAEVTAATDPDPAWRRLQFRTTRVLRGEIGAEFAVLEPSGACCGRSLFALLPGAHCLLFLERRSTALHPLGGARGVLPADAGLVAHVAALLAAGGDGERAALLARSLLHAERRVAEDAAHALAAGRPADLDAAARANVLAAFGSALERGTTVLAPLAQVAARSTDPELFDAVLAGYVATPRTDQARLLRRTLAQAEPARVAGRVALHARAGEQRELRTAELLAELPFAEAQAPLQNLLRGTQSPRVQLRIAEAMLAATGGPSALPARLPDPVLDLAARRQRAARVFRSIAPAPAQR